MNEQLLKTSGADVSSSWKKLKKTSESPPPPLPFYVRGLSHRDGIWKKSRCLPWKDQSFKNKNEKKEWYQVKNKQKNKN